MTGTPSYEITAQWGARAETPAALATRFLRTVDAVSGLDPLLRKWTWGDYPELWESEGKEGEYPFEMIIPRLAHAIERNANIDDDDPAGSEGYWMMVIAGRSFKPSGPSLSVDAGNEKGSLKKNLLKNKATMDFGDDPPPHLVTYSVLREAMLILCENWDVILAKAEAEAEAPAPATWPQGVALPSRTFTRGTWMRYISPPFAPLITPPASVICERFPDGGLFLAATDEPFDTANPAHMAAADAIDLALRPLIQIL